ncbi:ABC transporter permease [Kribbella ginsengisoli]|uniref:ABC3 transporter permease C-terminal domain-containing protein n=1 Tax=Kribbella ginsengisoli TaxID=363865 RepID=A0ABP6YM24_9ACTN
MIGLAGRLLRHRPGTVLATLIALAAGVMVMTGTGALVESGLRHQPKPQLHGAADLVVAKRDITFTGKEFGGDTYTTTTRLPEPGTMPATLVDQLRQLPGVAEAVADPPTSAKTPPGRVEVIAITEEAGADRGAVKAAVEKLAAAESAKAYAGNAKGIVERPDLAAARDLLIQVGAAFGGYVVMLIVFVVAGTIGLSIRGRRRELALLRATGATPWQLRRMLMGEAAILGGIGSVIGIPTGLLASRWMGDQLIGRGFVPADFPMGIGVLAAPAAALLIVVLAVVAALLASRRISAIRPAEALADAAVEPTRSGKVRLGFGLAALVGALSSSAFAVMGGGQAALGGAVSMLYLLVLAVALLAPWINSRAAKLLSPLLRAVWGNSGYLATRNLAANARGMATVLTALVLSVGFGGSVWFLQDNLERQTVQQVQAGTLAQYAVVSPKGLPDDAAERLSEVPGVEAATGVRRTSVIVKVMQDAEVVPAQAMDLASALKTTDLQIKEGELTPGGVAVSQVRASSQNWKLGDTADIWLADGTPKHLKITAIYSRGLGFGDFILDRATVGQAPDEVLLRTSGSKPTALPESATLIPVSQLTVQTAKDLAISAWLNKLLIGVMIAYAALAAANTMIMAALARRREVAVLRLTGVTTRQVKRMVNAEQAGLLGVAVVIGGTIAAVTLTTVVRAVTGGALPYVPALGWIAVLGGATLLAMTTTILPIALLLRRPALAQAGSRE